MAMMMLFSGEGPEPAMTSGETRAHWSTYVNARCDVTAMRDPENAPQTWLQPISKFAPIKWGAPSIYDPAYCDMVIETMAAGFSLTAFGAKIGVLLNTITDWRRSFPDFDRACAYAKSRQLFHFEEAHLGVVRTGGVGSQGQAAWRGLLNAGADEWKDKREVESRVTISLASMVEQSIKPMIDITPAAQD